MKRLGLLAACLAVVLAACGGGSSDDGSGDNADKGGPPPQAARVVAKDLAFKPSKVRLAAGGTVTWEFKDGATPHNVTADDKAYASNNESSGTYSHTYDKPGTYKYTCTIHPAMKGTVVVS